MGNHSFISMPKKIIAPPASMAHAIVPKGARPKVAPSLINNPTIFFTLFFSSFYSAKGQKALCAPQPVVRGANPQKNLIKVNAKQRARKLESEVKKMAEPRFEIFTDDVGQFRFRLKAPNEEIIAASEGYTTKESCEKGIESVRRNAPIAKLIDLTI
jgi:uncharacterized protein YegP (UPF0339 family)